MNTHEISREIVSHACHLSSGVEEEIRHRAYQIWEERGRHCDGALDDWLKAEAEILSRHVFHCVKPMALTVH